MANIVADPSLLEDEDRLPKRQGSWRTTFAVLALPCAALFLLCALAAWTETRQLPIEKAIVSSGLPLYGPFTHGIVLEQNWLRDAVAAWGVLLVWSLIVRVTPIGKWHWLIHGGLVAAWFIVGFWFMLLGGVAIT